MKRWARRFAAALFGLWVVTSLYSLRPVGHDPEPIAYLLTWEADGVEWGTDGSWTVTNDLGYEVNVLNGYVVTYEATAVACADESSWLDTARSIVGVFVPDPAWSGHGESADETTVGEVVESLTEPVSASLGSGWTTAANYCRSHLAFGTSKPSETTLHLSLLIDGTRSVEVDTDVSWGTLGELTGELNGDDQEVEIVRSLSTMFDGIDFDTIGVAEIAQSVLRSLSSGIVFHAA